MLSIKIQIDMSQTTVTLNDGYTMPVLGLGTARAEPEELEEAVKYAIDIGYRHIDTAHLYENEKYIGNAIREKIKDGTVRREDLFITTKLSYFAHKENEVFPACKQSLNDLGLDYIDLYLIHWPIALKKSTDFKSLTDRGTRIVADIDYLETWKGMETCKRFGLTHSIGVSNFNSEQIKRLITTAQVKPVNNQVEVSLNLNQKALIKFCKEHNIVVTGYSPFGNPGNSRGLDNLWNTTVIQELSYKYNKTPAQVSLRFILQMGSAIIPKSVTKSRIKENIEIFDFNLTSSEMIKIQALETGNRLITYETAKNDKFYPFNIPY